MIRFRYNQVEETRECNKISLDTFTFDKYNVIDSPIDNIIKEIKLKIERNMKNIKNG